MTPENGCALDLNKIKYGSEMLKYIQYLLQGLNLLIPVADSIKYVQSLKEIAIDIPQQSAITAGQSFESFVSD